MARLDKTLSIRRHNLPLPGTTRISLCDQPLQLRNARTAIGARLQLRADVRRGTRAGGDGVADRVAAHAEAGTDDGTGISKAIDRLARKEHAALVVAERIRRE